MNGKKEYVAGAKPFARLEELINEYTSLGVHLFLSVLAVIVFAAALVATVVVFIHDFPSLFQAGDEYGALQTFVEDILLIAIAGELALLLLFHRTSAAVEVIIFVIARKMVSPDLTATDLLLGAVGLTLLIAVRVYFISGKKIARGQWDKEKPE
jgi:hypothetical protein